MSVWYIATSQSGSCISSLTKVRRYVHQPVKSFFFSRPRTTFLKRSNKRCQLRVILTSASNSVSSSWVVLLRKTHFETAFQRI